MSFTSVGLIDMTPRFMKFNSWLNLILWPGFQCRKVIASFRNCDRKLIIYVSDIVNKLKVHKHEFFRVTRFCKPAYLIPWFVIHHSFENKYKFASILKFVLSCSHTQWICFVLFVALSQYAQFHSLCPASVQDIKLLKNIPHFSCTQLICTVSFYIQHSADRHCSAQKLLCMAAH